MLGRLVAAGGAGDDRSVEVRAALRMAHAEDCVRFERESFGALHQMLTGVAPDQRAEVWQEISTELARFEEPEGFEGPCELIVA